MEERAKVCIDRVLPNAVSRPQRTIRRPNGALEAIGPIGKTWMNGSTLRVLFMEGDDKQRDLVLQQAQWWSQVANLGFDFNDAPDAEIRITFDSGDGAWSYVGTDCKSIELGQPTMNLGFLDGGTAAHEFGHAIGLAHEHQNPDGGIRWNEEAVIRDMEGPPNYWDVEKIRHNILRKYSIDQINGTDFDPASIMLYFFPATWTLNGIGTKANDILSTLDKAFIAGAKMYPKTAVTAATATTLEVNADDPTEASIGKFSEEDLYKFTADTDGRYVIETLGPTDLVMKLFGPDNQTALIAEDDDGGVDANARIHADLVAGEYFIQVRHYNLAGGTGKYAVRVRRT